MEDKKLGKVLKEERIRAGLSVEEVSDLLIGKGHKATPSSIYNWENDISQPKPGILLDMCRAYGIKDVLRTFGYLNEDGETFTFTAKEQEMIEKYRVLDDYGTRTVDTVLGIEYERCMTAEFRVMDNVRTINYYLTPASAGPGQILFDDVDVEQLTIPDDPDYKRVAYAVGVRGDSMEPLFHDDDILLVEPGPDIRVGEIGIFYVDGQSYIKELGHGELISANPAYGTIPLDEESRCMGRVIDKL